MVETLVDLVLNRSIGDQYEQTEDIEERIEHEHVIKPETKVEQEKQEVKPAYTVMRKITDFFEKLTGKKDSDRQEDGWWSAVSDREKI